MSTDTGSEEPPVLSRAAQPLYVVYPSKEGETYDLVDVVAAIWERRWMVIAVVAACSVLATAYAFIATPVYRAEVVLSPNTSEQQPNLPAGLSGLADFVGINLGSSADATEALATLRSRALLEEFIQDKKLLPVLFADKWDAKSGRWISDDPDDWPDIREGVRFFMEKVRSIDDDSSTGLVTLSIKWTDPEIAAQWASDLVTRVNERMRARDLADSKRRLQYLNGQLDSASLVELRQAIGRLIEDQIRTIMLAEAEAEYAFKVIDPPRAPDKPAAPNKPLVIAIGVVAGGVLGVLIALFHWSWIGRRQVRSD